MAHAITVDAIFDPVTGTVGYVVADRKARRAAVIDPVLDFDPKSGRISTATAEKLAALIGDCTLDWAIETHAHADHLSAASWFKHRYGAKIATGTRVGKVQVTWARIFNFGPDFPVDGRQFDRLLAEGDTIELGAAKFTVWSTPGHTPSCTMLALETGEGPAQIFLGDTMFMPDLGTARCDFPGGDARTLYRSIRRVLALPGDTILHVCHDYPPETRGPRMSTTVAEQRAGNIHVRDGIDEDSFVKLRETRDKTLAAPVLLLPSIQVNIRAGELPPPEANGTRYLKIPLDAI